MPRAKKEQKGAAAERPSLSTMKGIVQEEVSQQVSDLGYMPEQAELEDVIADVFEALVRAGEFELSERERADMRRELVNDMLYFGPLEPFLSDPSVTEIIVEGAGKIYLETDGELHLAEGARFDSEEHLRRIIDQIATGVGRRIDDSSPLLDARLPDGSRVNAVIPPIALDGSYLTVRKFARDRMTVEGILDAGSASPAMIAFLQAAVAGRRSIVIAGGTGTGKTTMLNALSHSIPANEAIVTIEDSAELQLAHENLRRMESRPANIEGKGEVLIRDLVHNALRMRPDRIIVGECRKEEAVEMFEAMTTGHDGSLTTVHASNLPTTFLRLKNMVKRAQLGYDDDTIRDLIAQAVSIVVIIKRYPDRSRKIESIYSLNGRTEGGTICREELFRFEREGFDADGRVVGSFAGLGMVPAELVEQIEDAGARVDRDWFFDRYDPSAGRGD